MSGWGCPHNSRDDCLRVPGMKCDPGMKGCVMFGKVRFANPDKNHVPARKRREMDAAKKDAAKGAF